MVSSSPNLCLTSSFLNTGRPRLREGIRSTALQPNLIISLVSKNVEVEPPQQTTQPHLHR